MAFGSNFFSSTEVARPAIAPDLRSSGKKLSVIMNSNKLSRKLQMFWFHESCEARWLRKRAAASKSHFARLRKRVLSFGLACGSRPGPDRLPGGEKGAGGERAA